VVQVRELAAEARRIGRKAEKEGDLRCTLAAVKQMGDFLDLIAKLTGQYTRMPRRRPGGARRPDRHGGGPLQELCRETPHGGITAAFVSPSQEQDGQLRELPQ